MNAHPGAARVVASALAQAARPVPPTPFASWLTTNIVLVDGPQKGEFWSAVDAPYLVEIAQCLDVEHPCNLVTVRKSQQTGVSILGLAWMLYLAEMAPDNALYGVPGIDALKKMNSAKLQPLIDAWQEKTGKRVIFPVKDRSGNGSNIYEKKFSGGAIYLGNANVKMDFSGDTTRWGVKDEVSKWSQLTDGTDPEALFFGRFTAFRRKKTYKILELSTPELDSGDPLGDLPGHCRIDRSFRRSDQRFWNIRCAECNKELVQGHELLLIDKKQPFKTVLRCPHCTHHISEMERVQGVRLGRYIPTFTDVDRHPGFHVDAFMSLMMSYEAIAEDFIKTEGKGEAGAKDYFNLIRGLPYEMKGNAPEHQRLMERREDYTPGTIPAGGLLFTVGADVQSYGIYVEAVTFAEDRQSWSVTATLLEGATDNVQQGAWTLLTEFVQQEYPDAHGVLRKIDAIAVDSGYRTNQVLEWCRRTPNAYAVKGQGGRGVPAISVPTKKSVTQNGKRRRFGSARVWPVGTWALKAELYGNLHKTGLRAGEAADPPGYCHFHQELGEEYFKQLTAEYFESKLVNGKLREDWKPLREDNHFLDCRVYGMAMAEHLGLSRNTKDAWARLRALLEPQTLADLLSPAPIAVTAAAAAEVAVATAAPVLEKPAENRWKKRK